ncbi:MAG TPA: hypothetical protein PLZ32_08135 [Saprospiraceae bacterium]|nr:hypothetical protein [Saprospiraceae bacterium]
MRYKGKACEIVSDKKVFGQRIAWIRLVEDGSFHEVPYDEFKQGETHINTSTISKHLFIESFRKNNSFDDIHEYQIRDPYFIFINT